MLRHFIYSILFTVAAVVGASIFFGIGAGVTTLILIAIEIAFSFDNAVINAKTLDRLSPFWQKLFLTLGMVIAVLGMRLVFPIFIVVLTAQLGWHQVVDLALNDSERYAHYLEQAHVSIASFGGGFLLVLSLYFLLDHEREVIWLHRIEKPLQRLKGGSWLPPLVGVIAITVLAQFTNETSKVLQAGIAGALAYALIHLTINGLGKLTGQDSTSTKHYVGWAALTAFIYLEVLDASFSFDGVLGAFAITNSVPIIALGLGVGALWVRSLTLFMVKNGTLSEYRYLEHGAHYAIFVLSVALLASLFYEVPDAVTGITGLGVIGASIYSSKARHPKSR